MSQPPKKPYLNPWEENDPTNVYARPYPQPPSPEFIKARNTAIGALVVLVIALFAANQFVGVQNPQAKELPALKAYVWAVISLVSLWSMRSEAIRQRFAGLLPKDPDEKWQVAYENTRWASLKVFYIGCIPLIICILLVMIYPHGPAFLYRILIFDIDFGPLMMPVLFALAYNIKARHS